MGNYSTNESSCRVDLFKESGKWYTTIEVDFNPYYAEPEIHKAFRKAMYDACKESFIGLQAICLQPYHKHEHPISMIWDGRKE